jgi:hypothetical protein
VELLGPENVHISVYENDADTAANVALASFKDKLECQLPSILSLSVASTNSGRQLFHRV